MARLDEKQQMAALNDLIQQYQGRPPSPYKSPYTTSGSYSGPVADRTSDRITVLEGECANLQHENMALQEEVKALDERLRILEQLVIDG